jgi:uncharacterized FAD-dependent dehydrogenase
MTHTVHLSLLPAAASDQEHVRAAAELAAGWPKGRLSGLRIVRRSIDARGRTVKVILEVTVSDEGPLPPTVHAPPPLPDVSTRPPVLIVGAGPAGLFAALRCIEKGRRPIVLERGKDVQARRRDLAGITQRHVVDGDSNYCFGEGGAGTYSDGKLYTRSGKRGDVTAVLEAFVAYGASPEILVDAHPHIGTNKLPAIVARLREAIRGAGGEVRFGARMTGLLREGTRIRGVALATGEELVASRVILATGHSARDVFELLVREKVTLYQKGFALGVRVEHPQSVIDEIRYHGAVRDPHLPPASYSAVHQVGGRGVYAFCMCPGGIIAPCATANDEVVTNGWSPSKRNNPFANSGIVVEVPAADGREATEDPLAGVRYQSQLERAAWEAGGRSQAVPGQRLVDFTRGVLSSTLPPCSYPPGVVSHRVDQLLPKEISTRLAEGLLAFGRSMRGYLTNDAIVVAVESRTSSPVRIPRDPVTLEHEGLRGLYPCGEGAGYAGGIVSAAIDGIRCADRACSEG